MSPSDPTAEQIRLVVVVYLSALGPLLLVPWLHARGRIPGWVLPVYAGSFLLCALGWELWFSYGWVAGDPVDARRAAWLSQKIPLHLNWLLNSLADAGSICLVGLYLAWRLRGRDAGIFRRWDAATFAILLVWFVAQNVFVEMFLYHDQLAEGKALSWAPLVPTGPWWNPVLFEFRDRTITLQGQVSWLLTAPIFYAGVIGLVRRHDRRAP